MAENKDLEEYKVSTMEDEEDYFDEFGVQMPEEVKFQNIYLIGKNLYDCFSRMIPV